MPEGVDDTTIWLGNIPQNAHIGQLLGALKDQGYKACNKMTLNKSNKDNTQWTIVKLQNNQSKQKALKYGIKFGNPPQKVINLNVQDDQSSKIHTKSTKLSRSARSYDNSHNDDIKQNDDTDTTIWLGNIPQNAHIGQLLGALKDQGYKACNRMTLKKSNKDNTQWTTVKLANSLLKEKAFKFGIKFGNSPQNIIQLTVDKNWSSKRDNKPNKFTKGGRSKTDNNQYSSYKQGTYSPNKSIRGKGGRTYYSYGGGGRGTYNTPSGRGGRRGGRRGGYQNRYNTPSGRGGRGRGGYHNKSHQEHVGFYMTAIIDMSGSMAGSRIKAATAGLESLFGNLSDDDIISIIGFNSMAATLLEPSKHSDVKDKIPNILKECVNKVGGGTAMWDAMDIALEKPKQFFMKKIKINKKVKRKQRIIVVTDGEDTSSSVQPNKVIGDVAFLNMQSTHKSKEFTLTVIAVGEATESADLQKLCKPKYCYLVKVDDFNGIANAIGNAFK